MRNTGIDVLDVLGGCLLWLLFMLGIGTTFAFLALPLILLISLLF